jgi:hypothetical protein
MLLHLHPWKINSLRLVSAPIQHPTKTALVEMHCYAMKALIKMVRVISHFSVGMKPKL